VTATRSRRTGVRMKTHAKVNLFLRVLGRRADGYHEIEAILHGTALADELELRATSSGAIDVDMNLAGGLRGPLPSPAEDLVARAARIVADAALRSGRNRPAAAGGRWGAVIRVVKHVPIGAGLGGGSSNGAGTLVALNELWGGPLSGAELASRAALLGSDVPYFLEGGTALATSRGEEITPLVSTSTLWLVLGISHAPLATGEVYAAWDAVGSPSVNAAPLVMALGAGDAVEIGPLLHNDLETAAFRLRPGLARAKEAMLAAGSVGAAMSGSGPTIFGIARDRAHAGVLAARVEDAFDLVVVTCSHEPSLEYLH
jgi:4-diphosphocytidyl-2-C-methyl-D-erythritol kinase